MSVSGFAGTVSGCLLRVGASGRDPRRRGFGFWNGGGSRLTIGLVNLRSRDRRNAYVIRSSAMDASFGDDISGPNVFSRIHIRDPYKRLGISKDASEEEIQAARNFLIQKHAGHKPSIDAIESAHDKIIMQKFYEKSKPNIDITKKVREVKQSKFVQFFANRYQTPSTKVSVQAFITFLVLGLLTVLFPTEDGPTLQVAMSFVANIYFIHSRLKSKFKAVFCGFASFFLAWMVGTFLMVTVIPPPIFRGLRAFEVTTSLITYVLLWVSSISLK